MIRPRIFYVALDEPTGGEIDTYHHVDVLNGGGFEAYAVHGRPGFRHAWFDNETRTIEMNAFWRLYDQHRDFIVIPEPLAPRLAMYPGKKVIFNKNLYHGFHVFGRSPYVDYPYEDENVVGVFTVSDHNARHLRHAFPRADVFRMYTRIDTDLFAYTPMSAKSRRICFVAKAEPELAVLCHTLGARAKRGENALAKYEWSFLSGYPQQRVAELLKGAILLVTLSTHEGLPRAALEGMACGCIVLGYGTGPMKECLLPQFQSEPDDFLRLAQQIESITSQFLTNAAQLTAWAAPGRGVAASFNRERQAQALLAAWDAILAGRRGDTRGLRRRAGMAVALAEA